MEQESDYILREVKRITAFLSKLITDFGGLENDDFESEIKASDDFIRQEWNISLQEIATITKVELSEKLKDYLKFILKS